MLKIGNPWKLMVWLMIYDLVAEENQYHAASLPRSVAIPYAKNIQVSMQRQQFQVTKPFSFHVTFYDLLWPFMSFYASFIIFPYVFLYVLLDSFCSGNRDNTVGRHGRCMNPSAAALAHWTIHLTLHELAQLHTHLSHLPQAHHGSKCGDDCCLVDLGSPLSA